MTSKSSRSVLTGHLTRHKTILTWSYTAATLDVEHPTRSTPRHNVEVAVMATSVEQPIKFEATCKDLGVTLTDTDAQRLHERMRETLDAVVEVKDGATWTPWLEVCIGAGHSLPYEGNIRKLEVSYKSLLHGTHPRHPGQAFTVNDKGHVIPFPKPLIPGQLKDVNAPFFAQKTAETAEELTQLLSQRDHRTPNMTYAYLPDTSVHREALDRILTAMDELTERLHTLLHPEQVTQTLTHLPPGPLLGHTA